MFWGWWGAPVPAAASAAPEEGGWAPAGHLGDMALAGWQQCSRAVIPEPHISQAHSVGPDCALKQPVPRTRILAGGPFRLIAPFTALALLPGHSVSSGGLWRPFLISDHCSSPLFPVSRASPGGSGSQGPSASLALAVVMCPHLVFGLCGGQSHWLILPSGTSPGSRCSECCVGGTGALVMRRDHPADAGETGPHLGSLGGCLDVNYTQWACGSEEKYNTDASSRACIRSCSFCL